MQFVWVNSEIVARRKVADSRHEFEGSHLVASKSISYKEGCREDPKLRATPCNLSWSTLKQWQGAKGDSRPECWGSNLMACKSISYEKGCYEELEVGATTCNLSCWILKQWHGEKGQIVDLTLRGQISWPVSPFHERNGVKKSQSLGQHHAI